MPPMMGAAVFLMAEFLHVPFTEVTLAAQFRAVEVLTRGWPYIVPFVVIIVALFSFSIRRQSAAIWAIGIVVPIASPYAYHQIRVPWRKRFAALGDTGLAVSQPPMVSGMAGIVIKVLNTTGLGFALTQSIFQLSGGNIVTILLLAGAISIILDMGMPTVGVYPLLMTLVIPSMVEANIPPMVTHMFAFYFGFLSMITPPVAVADFTATTVGKADFLLTVFHRRCFRLAGIRGALHLHPRVGDAVAGHRLGGRAHLRILRLQRVPGLRRLNRVLDRTAPRGLARLAFIAAGVLGLLHGSALPAEGLL